VCTVLILHSKLNAGSTVICAGSIIHKA
jgi:hypothetical protein